jgi:alpha-tubulin suppressor-like RCC1 family protein
MAAAVGRHHSAAVGDDGALFVWGHDGNGQLGTGDTANRLARTRIAGLPAHVRQVAAGDFHTGIVTEAGDLLMCGYGRDGRLGLGDEDDRTTPTLVARAVFDGEAVLVVACGARHTAAVTEEGGVYTLRRGIDGRLGHGDEEDQLAPRRVPAAGFNGERVVMVAANHFHTVALNEAGHGGRAVR